MEILPSSHPGHRRTRTGGDASRRRERSQYGVGGLKFAFDTTFIGLVLVIPTMLYLLALRARAQKLDMVYYQILLDRRFHAAP